MSSKCSKVIQNGGESNRVIQAWKEVCHSNFWRLRSSNHVKFILECVMFWKKYVLVEEMFTDRLNMSLRLRTRAEDTVHGVKTHWLLSKAVSNEDYAENERTHQYWAAQKKENAANYSGKTSWEPLGKEELISDSVLWTTTHGHTSVSQPAKTYIYRLFADTGCFLEELPRATADKDEWREREIRALSLSIYIYIYMKHLLHPGRSR